MPYLTHRRKAALSTLALGLLSFARMGDSGAWAQEGGLPAGWRKLTSEAFRFSVTMPGEPQEQILEAENTVTHQFFLRLQGGRSAFMVRIQRAEPNYFFTVVPDGVAERYVRAVAITLDSQRAFTFAGARAHEALCHDGEVEHRVIWLVANNSLYVVAAAGPSPFRDGADARRFFESFQLLADN
jgi:hypothetical protein